MSQIFRSVQEPSQGCFRPLNQNARLSGQAETREGIPRDCRKLDLSLSAQVLE